MYCAQKSNKSLSRQGWRCSPLERVALPSLFLHRTCSVCESVYCSHNTRIPPRARSTSPLVSLLWWMTASFGAACSPASEFVLLYIVYILSPTVSGITLKCGKVSFQTLSWAAGAGNRQKLDLISIFFKGLRTCTWSTIEKWLKNIFVYPYLSLIHISEPTRLSW